MGSQDSIKSKVGWASSDAETSDSCVSDQDTRNFQRPKTKFDIAGFGYLKQ